MARDTACGFVRSKGGGEFEFDQLEACDDLTGRSRVAMFKGVCLL